MTVKIPSHITTFLSDMDGVIYRGKQIIPGSLEAVKRLTEIGDIYFMTNNSSKDADESYRSDEPHWPQHPDLRK